MKFKNYDYKARKAKVEEILDNTKEVKKVNKFPVEDSFTYKNGYKAWAGAIFVDLRDSTTLFSGKNDVDIAKVIRGFTSEIIEILRKDHDDQLVEIGIRGDCVFAVYSVPTQNDIYDVANRAFHINTYMKMLNKLLADRGLPTVQAGIGLAAKPTLAVKAGRESSGINNLVWIGEAVAKASKLSGLGHKNGIAPIVMSSVFYSNYIKAQPVKGIEKEWTKAEHNDLGSYYHGNLVKTAFNDWITDGMKDK